MGTGATFTTEINEALVAAGSSITVQATTQPPTKQEVLESIADPPAGKASAAKTTKAPAGQTTKAPATTAPATKKTATLSTASSQAAFSRMSAMVCVALFAFGRQI